MVGNKFVIDSGKECLVHCPHENMTANLEINGNAVLKLRYLQDKFKDVEFLVYGNARKIDNLDYLIDDIVIPEQVVGAASVDNIKIEGNYNTVIHKHPGNVIGFSSIDEEYVNANHDFSIIIGNDTKLSSIKGIASIQIDCGRYMKAKLDIDVVIPGSKDEEFIKSAKDKVKIAISDQTFLSRLGLGKKENSCNRCGQPLEKKVNDWQCTRCEIIYTKLK